MSILQGWVDYNDASSLGARLRLKRIAPLTDMIKEIHGRKGAVRIIDIGGTDRYWKIFPPGFIDKYRISITIANLAGAVERSELEWFSYLEIDACNLSSIPDKSFDIAHSNSVVEHVGDWGRMKSFASEVSRVADGYFVQTPNYWFPVEPHFIAPVFHWLPRPLQLWVVLRFSLGNYPRAASITQAMSFLEDIRLLNRLMFQDLFRDGRILTERFLLLPKSFVAVRSAE